MLLEIIDKKDVIEDIDENENVEKHLRNIPLVSESDVRVRKVRNKGVDEFRYLKPHYFDNIYCSIYLNFVQRYIRQVVGAYRKGKYWIMCVDGKNLKVRHLSTCLRTTYNEYAWYYPINFDKKADAFLFSAFSDRITLEPVHLLFIKKDEIIRVGDGQKQLWNRARLIIDAKMISRLKKFEMYDNLANLVEIMKEVSIRENEKNKNDLRRRLVTKQHEIRKKTGYNFNLEFLIHQAIITGLGDIERLYGLDKFGDFGKLYDTRLDLIRELGYILNKEELDNELIEVLKNLSVVLDIRVNKLMETAMSIGLDMLYIDIILDMIKVEEFIKMDEQYNDGRHIGSWKGKKEYLKSMNPILREGLANILKTFYLDMLR